VNASRGIGQFPHIMRHGVNLTCYAAVVDPGGDLALILDALERQGVELEKILLTNAHIDHYGGTAQLAQELGLPAEGPLR
jgi:glyoxylase-like metal-dependent hydrolase (beta-lactamase superfamily II)